MAGRNGGWLAMGVVPGAAPGVIESGDVGLVFETGNLW